MQAPNLRGRSFWTNLEELPFHYAVLLPGPNLAETCKYFVRRLPEHELGVLKERLHKLDGQTISIGSTCSGSDICVCIMKSTMQKLSEMFGVTYADVIQKYVL